MTDRALRLVAVILAVILTAVIGSGAAVGQQRVAESLARQVRAALDAAGLADVTAAVRGREVDVSGGSRHDLTRAAQVVRDVAGVRSVDIRFDDPVDQAHVWLQVERSQVRIDGVVPDASTASRLKVGAARAFGLAVHGDLDIDDAVAPPLWAAELPGAFGEMAALKELDLRVEGTTLWLRGTIESQAGHSRALRLIRSALPHVSVREGLDVDARGLPANDAELFNTVAITLDGPASALSAEDSRALADVAAALERTPGVTLRAAAHSGPNSTESDARLSRQRVEAVVAYLIDLGVDGSRLETAQFDLDQQISSDLNAEQFRRIDFVVKGD